MKTLLRLLVALPIAGLMTVALFGFMIFLISDDFEAQEKLEALDFEINPQAEEIIERRRTVQRAVRDRAVETPPPAPSIDVEEASKPTEAIATVSGAIPTFEKPKLDRKDFKIQVSDRDAQPLVRMPGKVPDRALRDGKSGHCKMRFDVNTSGVPFNINAYFCTAKMFERESVRATGKFKYRPKIVDGNAVEMRGVETKITYRVTDERGNILPE